MLLFYMRFNQIELERKRKKQKFIHFKNTY